MCYVNRFLACWFSAARFTLLLSFFLLSSEAFAANSEDPYLFQNCAEGSANVTIAYNDVEIEYQCICRKWEQINYKRHGYYCNQQYGVSTEVISEFAIASNSALNMCFYWEKKFTSISYSQASGDFANTCSPGACQSSVFTYKCEKYKNAETVTDYGYLSPIARLEAREQILKRREKLKEDPDATFDYFGMQLQSQNSKWHHKSWSPEIDYCTDKDGAFTAPKDMSIELDYDMCQQYDIYGTPTAVECSSKTSGEEEEEEEEEEDDN